MFKNWQTYSPKSDASFSDGIEYPDYPSAACAAQKLINDASISKVQCVDMDTDEVVFTFYKLWTKGVANDCPVR